jgi:hypothetical protein
MTPKEQAQQDSLSFLEELGYRFPDMTDYEVMLAYSEYVGIQMVPDPTTLWGMRLIEVYEKGVTRNDVRLRINSRLE